MVTNIFFAPVFKQSQIFETLKIVLNFVQLLPTTMAMKSLVHDKDAIATLHIPEWRK